MALLLSKVSSLSTEKAAAILRSPSYLRKASGRPPVKPHSGDVYIFHAELEKQGLLKMTIQLQKIRQKQRFGYPVYSL